MRYLNLTSINIAFKALMEGFPWDDLRKFCTDVRGWSRYTAVKNCCQKGQTPEYGAPTLQTTDRQTDDRRICDSKDPNVT